MDGDADELRFSVNYVASPKLVGQSDTDERTLGLMLDYLQIQPHKLTQ
jgi:hypothetical protein